MRPEKFMSAIASEPTQAKEIKQANAQNKLSHLVVSYLLGHSFNLIIRAEHS